MQLSINIPDNIFFGINETEKSLTQILKQKLAIELYKSHQISITQGAKLVSMDIYEFMKLLSEHQIPVIDDYDIEDEVANAKRIFSQTAGLLSSQQMTLLHGKIKFVVNRIKAPLLLFLVIILHTK